MHWQERIEKLEKFFQDKSIKPKRQGKRVMIKKFDNDPMESLKNLHNEDDDYYDEDEDTIECYTCGERHPYGEVLYCRTCDVAECCEIICPVCNRCSDCALPNCSNCRPQEEEEEKKTEENKE
jgi:hypothetical protein